MRKKQHADGVSFSGVLLGNRDSVERDTLYWHYPHNRHEAAVREGRYKLLHRFKETVPICTTSQRTSENKPTSVNDSRNWPLDC